MLNLALAIIPVFVLLIVTEFLWRTNKFRGESARKLIHILVGSYVAFWPFFISFENIQLVSAVFLMVGGVSYYFIIFMSIHGVARRTWGEVLFAVGIGLVALLTNEPWVFAVCILHLSIADGLAALAGIRWGKTNSYKVFGHTKSIIGTTVFWFCSLVIMMVAIYNLPSLQNDPQMMLIWVPVLTSFAENIGFGGTDNVMVPLVVLFALS